MSARMAAVAAALIAAVPASAQGAERVRIVSPKDEAMLTTRDVTVKLRSPSRPQVTMYGRGRQLRNLSSRFRRAARGTYVARLRAGRRLQFGRNHIYARVDGAIESRHFTVVRRAGRSMMVRRIEHGRNEHPPLDLRVRAAGTTLLARLNGRSAGEAFEQTARGRWTAALTTRHGLRFGRNRMVLTVFGGKTFQRERRTFFVGRARPLADAGRNRLARAGHGVQLDGRGTRAAPRAGLRLRWRIVRKPSGSQPRLTRARGKRPLLHADANGRYRIALHATHAPRNRASTAQAAPAAVDTVEVVVQPNTLPSGVPVQTLATGNGSLGISVGDDFYPMEAGAAIQLLVLDRTTLDRSTATNVSYPAGQEQALLTEIDGLPSLNPPLVILTGGGGPAYDAPAAVQQAINKIGGKLDGGQTVGNIGELTGGHGGWSVIGIPGIPSGQAYQLIGLQQGPNAVIGSMRGNLQHDSSGVNYAFNWTPEYHPFDTRQSTTPTGNAMSVDGATYTSWNLPFPGRTGTVGFQLLWFDADTLTLRSTQTYDADLNQSYDDIRNLSPGWEHGMWGLRDQLRQINADPKPGLLFLNTIGSVPTLYFNGGNRSDGNDVRGDVMARVTALVEEFGANRYAFIGLGRGGGPGAQGGYSLVGVTGLRYLKGPNAAAELSTRLNPGTTARLAGALKRSRQGVLQAASTGSPSAGGDPTVVQPDIQRILAQSDPFPRWSELSPAEQSAQKELAGKLTPGPMAVDTTTIGIRANYWQAPALNWGDLANQLRTVCAPTETNPTPCSTAAATLAPQLAAEFSDVGAVRGFLTGTDDGDLWNVFNDVFLSGSYDVDAVSNQIIGYFNPPQVSTSGPNALGILSGVLGITGAIGAFVPEGGEGIAAAADVAASVTDIVEASTADDNTGESKWDPYGFHSTVADLHNDLDDAFRDTADGLARLADLIVTDAGRLSAAAALAAKGTSAGGWDMPTDVQDQLKGRLLQTMRQFMWLTMMQPVAATYECAREDEGDIKHHNPAAALYTNINYPEWRPRGTDTWNLYPTWIMLANRNHWGWPQLLGKDVTGVLFGQPDYDFSDASATDGAGFIPEYLMNRAIAGGGQPVVDPDLNRDVYPVTQGLVHKNMGFGFDLEDSSGLSHRNDWSAYTPSCGWGQRLIWSDPDPRTPDSPYANP